MPPPPISSHLYLLYFLYLLLTPHAPHPSITPLHPCSQELDLREEASRLISFRSFLESSGLSPAVTCPLPVTELSGERVLTMTRLDGRN